MSVNMEKKSVSIEEFEEKYVPILNTVAELVISHPDIPEDVEQSDLLGSLTMLTMELRNGLNDRVPELVKLQEELVKKTKQVTKLQETNQQLFLKVGAYQDPDKKLDDPEKPKKSFDEIKAIISNL